MLWRRQQDEHRSGTHGRNLRSPASTASDVRLGTSMAGGIRTPTPTPTCADVLRGARERGLKIGVLSNTIWPRERHEQIFARDGITDLIDAAVYTSDIEWTKPHPEAFRAILAALGERRPGAAVFVGDRRFDDIHGAQSVGMRDRTDTAQRHPGLATGPYPGRARRGNRPARRSVADHRAMAGRAS